MLKLMPIALAVMQREWQIKLMVSMALNVKESGWGQMYKTENNCHKVPDYP